MRPLALLLVPFFLFACDDSGSGGSVEDAEPDAEGRILADMGTSKDGGGGGEGCEPGEETCNGVDDDCDDKIDEGFGLGAPCRSGMNDCAADGEIVCAEDGTAMCDAPAIEPSAELCDGLDNDCDGTADEDFVISSDPEHCGGCGQACSFDNAAALCAAGDCALGDCAMGFGDADGVAENGCECERGGEEELCDGGDTDCDGEVDEGFALGEACTVGVGVCARDGESICAEGGLGCSVEPAAPGEEVCNGLDDDCDGSTDEGFDGDGDGAVFCGLDCEAPCPEGVDCEALCRVQDCDDEDPARHPLARDLCGDEIDQNCDGVDASCAAPAGRITTLAIADAGAPGCRDFDGDGRSDNALALAALAANGNFADSIALRELNLVPIAIGMESPGTDGRFDFALVVGVAEPALQDYALSQNSVDENGDPIILLPGANVVEGAMQAGPGDFNLDLPFLEGVRINLRVRDTQLTGDMSVDAAGLTILDGWLTGIITDEDFQALIQLLPPDLAPFIEPLIQKDFDTDGDGELDAYTTCLSFTVTPINLSGFPVEL